MHIFVYMYVYINALISTYLCKEADSIFISTTHPQVILKKIY